MLEYMPNVIAFTGPDGIGKSTQAELFSTTINGTKYVKELDNNSSNRHAITNAYNAYIRGDIPLVTLADKFKQNRFELYRHTLVDPRTIYVVDRCSVCTYMYMLACGSSETTARSYLLDTSIKHPSVVIMLVGMQGLTRLTNRDTNGMFEDDHKKAIAELYCNEDVHHRIIIDYKYPLIVINNDGLTKEQTASVVSKSFDKYKLYCLSSKDPDRQMLASLQTNIEVNRLIRRYKIVNT
jgi:thymidylate kinase